MTLVDIKKELKGLGIESKNITGKKKAELEVMLDKCKEGLDQALPVLPVLEEEKVQQQPQPDNDNQLSPTDLGWTQYVLDWLDKSEKYDNKYPKVDGLRRFAEFYYGIESSTTKIVQAPNTANGGIAVVAHRVYFNNSSYFDGVADASVSNTDFPYSKYVTASAETRAEGRALRRALKLQVVTAEELQRGDTSIELDPKEGVSGSQVNFLTNMAIDSGRGCDANIEKLVKHLFGEHYTDVQQLSRGQAGILNQTLSSYQNDASIIPETVKGYDPDWSTNFYKEQ